MMSRILMILSLGLLQACISPDCGDPRTEIFLRFEGTAPYPEVSVVAFHGAKIDTVRPHVQAPNEYTLTGSRVLSAQESVFIRLLLADSVVFERSYDTRDPHNQIRFTSDTVGCVRGSREVFELPGGRPVMVCFGKEPPGCM